MKVLIDSFCPPFFLAHGGAQTQVVETVRGLRELGIDVEYARWWDGKQTGDLIHTFGVPNGTYIEFAKTKRIPIVNTTLFTATCNRPKWQLSLQGAMVSTLMKLPSFPPWGAIRSQLIWDSFNQCDLNIVGLNAEADVLRRVYSVPDSKIGIVPLGLPEIFLEAGHGTRNSDHLITTGTITERKRSVELARMAIAAQVPICFVGKPYDSNSQYWHKFQSLIDNRFVKHIPHTESVGEMVNLLKQSRGYVLYSDYENWCLSAHEAIACGLPIVVPDQPWSREIFGTQANYLLLGNPPENATRLKNFHNACPNLPAPDVKLLSWKECGSILVEIYECVLGNGKS